MFLTNKANNINYPFSNNEYLLLELCILSCILSLNLSYYTLQRNKIICLISAVQPMWINGPQITTTTTTPYRNNFRHKTGPILGKEDSKLYSISGVKSMQKLMLKIIKMLVTNSIIHFSIIR